MPELTETFVRKPPSPPAGTLRHWDREVKGFCLFVGERAKAWYFRRQVGGQILRVLIGPYPTIQAAAARQAALSLALDMSRGAGKTFQIGAPRFGNAMEASRLRPRLRSEASKAEIRQRRERDPWDWLGLPMDEIIRPVVIARHRERADRLRLPVTENGRSFKLPLVDLHHEILAPMRGLGGEWVFPSS